MITRPDGYTTRTLSMPVTTVVTVTERKPTSSVKPEEEALMTGRMDYPLPGKWNALALFPATVSCRHLCRDCHFQLISFFNWSPPRKNRTNLWKLFREENLLCHTATANSKSFMPSCKLGIKSNSWGCFFSVSEVLVCYGFHVWRVCLTSQHLAAVLTPSSQLISPFIFNFMK